MIGYFFFILVSLPNGQNSHSQTQEYQYHTRAVVMARSVFARMGALVRRR
jgi:hypothetical protein